MRYVINSDCYIIDEKGEVKTLSDPTFNIMSDTKLTTKALKIEIQKELKLLNMKLVPVEEYLTYRDDEIKDNAEIPTNTALSYELYVGKTGKEIRKKK